MKHLHTYIALFLLAITASAVPADARNNGWTLLGKRSVHLYGDHDVIPVTAARGDFRRIFLRVRGNGLFMNTMTVTYANGAPDRIPITYYIPQGSQTRAIDLRGHDRFMRQVDLSHRRVPNNRGKAVVELWGRH